MKHKLLIKLRNLYPDGAIFQVERHILHLDGRNTNEMDRFIIVKAGSRIRDMLRGSRPGRQFEVHGHIITVLA